MLLFIYATGHLLDVLHGVPAEGVLDATGCGDDDQRRVELQVAALVLDQEWVPIQQTEKVGVAQSSSCTVVIDEGAALLAIAVPPLGCGWLGVGVFRTFLRPRPARFAGPSVAPRPDHPWWIAGIAGLVGGVLDELEAAPVPECAGILDDVRSNLGTSSDSGDCMGDIGAAALAKVCSVSMLEGPCDARVFFGAVGDALISAAFSWFQVRSRCQTLDLSEAGRSPQVQICLKVLVTSSSSSSLSKLELPSEPLDTDTTSVSGSLQEAISESAPRCVMVCPQVEDVRHTLRQAGLVEGQYPPPGGPRGGHTHRHVGHASFW